LYYSIYTISSATNETGQKITNSRHVLEMALHICRGLNFLHTYEPVCVHRDLKPDNILVFSTADAPNHDPNSFQATVAEGGAAQSFPAVLKLTDFGFSRSVKRLTRQMHTPKKRRRVNGSKCSQCS
jgi:serine/threonine protein kinase